MLPKRLLNSGIQPGQLPRRFLQAPPLITFPGMPPHYFIVERMVMSNVARLLSGTHSLASLAPRPHQYSPYTLCLLHGAEGYSKEHPWKLPYLRLEQNAALRRLRCKQGFHGVPLEGMCLHSLLLQAPLRICRSSGQRCTPHASYPSCLCPARR